MRTSPGITEVETAAFTQFAMDYEIITDGETGVRNANILCTPIIDLDSDITPAALQASFQKVSAQLRLKGATYKKADELAGNLSPAEIDAYKTWARTQKLLIGLDGSTEGYQNVVSLLGWMRGNPVTAHNLDLALGNIINNPKVGQRIHFKPQPKAERPYGPGGKLNHAFGQEEPKTKAAAVGIQQQEYVNGRKNHAYTSPEEAAKKVAVQAPDAWQQICKLHLKEWVTQGQRVKLESEYNAGIATGKSWREIGAALGQIVKGWERGR
jgi:hypothetical protein